MNGKGSLSIFKKTAGKLLAFTLVGVLFVTGMAGCGKDETEKEKKKAKGRYVEKEIEMTFADDEQGVSLIRKQDGGYKLYTYLTSEKTYKAYESEDGLNFQESQVEWINGATGGEGVYLKSIFQGGDNKEYALYYKSEDGNHLIRTEDGSSTEEVLPEVFRERNGVEKAGILENGDVVISDTTEGKLLVYDIQNGTCKKTMEQGAANTTGIETFDCREGKAVTLSGENDGFTVFDLEKGEAVQKYVYDDMGEDYGVLRLGEDEDCYYLDRLGLHHMNKDGSTVETLVEGDMASMGDSTMSAKGFVQGEGKEYLALYNQEGNRAVLVRYVYDKEARVTADNQLVIYGLEENKTIKQAVSRFQKDHPDVRVRYKTGSGQENGTTRADQIRVLNTELLSGNGADILVLDGLPLESYIEKGVLMDMTGFYEELEKENPLLDNIVKSMKKEKGIYQMPVRMKVLAMYGSLEEVEALQSLDSLSSYLEQGDGKDILDNARSHEHYLRLLLNLNYKEVFTEDGKAVSEEELKKLLKTAKKLGESVGVEADTVKEFYLGRMPEMTEENLLKEMGEELLYNISTGNDLRARKHKAAVVTEAEGISDLMITCEVLRELGTSPQGIHGLYIPRGMVGVCESSGNKELAQEFLKTLFSEEIQSLDLNDGFPVNEKALEAWCTREKPDESTGSGLCIGGDDGEGGTFSAMEPSGEQLRPFVEIGQKADTPVLVDEAILEVILDEGIGYCKGEKILEKAVSGITNKIKTYLAQ